METSHSDVLFDNEWCKTLRCPKCFKAWYICTECFQTRTHIKDRSTLQRHYRERHRDDGPPIKKRKKDKENDKKEDDREEDYETVPTSLVLPSIVETPTTPLTSPDKDDDDDFVIFDEVVPYDDDEDDDDGIEEDDDDGKEDCPGQQKPHTAILSPDHRESKISQEALSFDRDCSTIFFEQELLRTGGGGRQLIAESFYKSQKAANDLEDDNVEICLQMALLVHSLTTRQNILLANLIDLLFQKIEKIRSYNSTKRIQRRDQCPNCSCQKCQNTTPSHDRPILPIPPRLPPLPRSMQKIRSVIISGKHAFLPKLAYPLVRKSGNHAYVIPSECIKLFLARGYLPMEFDVKEQKEGRYQAPNETPRGLSIAAKLMDLSTTSVITKRLRHIPLSFVEWRDDCEASRSNKVSKYGSVWVWTITIFEKESGADSPRATFPIAVGLKSDDHDEVEKIVSEDLKRLAETRTIAFLGCRHDRSMEEITFSAQVYLSLGDQPERRGCNLLMSGNSLSHARWMYAGNHEKLVSVLPACMDCLSNMKMADCHGESTIDWKGRSRQCNSCTNWAVDLESNMLHYQAPKHFPTKFKLGGEEVGEGETTGDSHSFLNPIVITYGSLIKVVKLTHKMLEDGKWTKAEALCHLKENAINAKYSGKIVLQGLNCWKYKLAFRKRNEFWEEWQKIEKEQLDNPSKYCMASLPSMWLRGLPLSLFIDTPMHLLFLGIAKSIFEYVGEWSKKCNRQSAFVAIAKSLLKQLEELKLDWLTFNVETFDSWGGWVSEKFQSLSRVALWVYGPLLQMDDVPPFVNPSSPVDDWKLEEYKKWMEVRGLPVDGFSRDILKENVKSYLLLPYEDQPKFLPPKYGNASTVLEVIRTMVLMMTTFLQPVIEGQSHADILSLRVRMFLNAVDVFENPMRDDRDLKKARVTKARREAAAEKKAEQDKVRQEAVRKAGGKVREPNNKKKESSEKMKDSQPLWLGRHNFMSLLNLPEIIREFGSPRIYYEGKYLGEKYVQNIKNARARCPPRNVTGTLLLKLHEAKALESMIETQSSVLKTFQSTGVAGNSTNGKLKGNVRVYKSKDDAKFAFWSKRPVSGLKIGGEFGILYYENGANKGTISMLQIAKVLFGGESIENGLRYWTWRIMESVNFVNGSTVQDFVVWLPKFHGGLVGEFTMVTKEWSPAMLEHYKFSGSGVDTVDEVKVDIFGRLML